MIDSEEESRASTSCRFRWPTDLRNSEQFRLPSTPSKSFRHSGCNSAPVYLRSPPDNCHSFRLMLRAKEEPCKRSARIRWQWRRRARWPAPPKLPPAGAAWSTRRAVPPLLRWTVVAWPFPARPAGSSRAATARRWSSCWGSRARWWGRVGGPSRCRRCRPWSQNNIFFWYNWNKQL